MKLLESDGKQPVEIAVDDVEDFLGQPLFRKEQALQRGIGVVTGLAWTRAWAAPRCRSRPPWCTAASRGFKLTGQLGEVMQESANIAYSYVRGNAGRIRRRSGDFFDEAFVHLHVPEGATPKDGPSAGVTMATALLSLATGKTSAAGFAMTGELTLTGQVCRWAASARS